MIFLNNISLSYGEKTIFDDVSLAITAGFRIGIVGDNGVGKTTLLQLIAGDKEPDAGVLDIPNRRNITIGFLPQELHEIGEAPIIQYLKGKVGLDVLEARLHTLESRIAETSSFDIASSEALLSEYERLHEKHTNLDGYSFEARAKQLLKGLGFKEKDYQKACGDFSGGWKMRIALAGILLSNPNIMLLDEPTNHLDTEAMEWLESYLKDYKGAFIVVSHDRYFLDKTVNNIWEIANARISIYKGNYSYYLHEKKRRQEAKLKAISLQKQKILRSKEFVERFRAKATKARQAQARLKVLEGMTPIATEREARTLRLSFPAPPKSAKMVCVVENVAKVYGEQRIFAGVDFSVIRGQKIAIVGANGEGKSTLMRLLAGRETPSKGRITYGEGVRIGFFSQESALEIRNEGSVWDVVANVGVASERQKRSLLGAFLFSGNDVQKATNVLSGGEKSRLALLKLLLTDANLLIMDEPTNHLDQKTRDVLLQALLEYSGTLVIVSHDRDLLDKLADKLLEVKNGVVNEYAGNYSYFIIKSRTSSNIPEALQVDGTAPAKAKTKAEKQQEADARNKRYRQSQRLMAAISQLEEDIVALEAKKSKCEAGLCDPSILRDGSKARAVNAEYEQIKTTLAKLSQEWEALSDELLKVNTE